MLKLKLENTLANWCEELTHLKRPWCWERLKAGEGDNRVWDGWMASPTRWTWVWASSRRWWRTGKPGVLQSMGSQRLNNMTEQLNNNFTSIRGDGGEGDGTPLQYSCLENPMDRGAWWATIHGVTQSRTRLKDWHCSRQLLRRLPRSLLPGTYVWSDPLLFRVGWIYDFFLVYRIWKTWGAITSVAYVSRPSEACQ